MKLRPFRVGGMWIALLLAGCKGDGAESGQAGASKDAPLVEPDPSREPDAPDRPAESDEAPEPKTETEPEPIPAPTFADEIGPLVAGEEPSADSGKTAWKHLKAKEYDLAQKHFALAALHDPESYKPAFNLACAAALAGDEPMTKVALTEAIKRDKDTVAPKARTDKDLASMRNKDWFETVLAGQSETEAADGGLTDADLEAEAAMYFVLAWGPKGPGGVAVLHAGGFMDWLDEGRALDLSPDGSDYVLRVNATPFIAANVPGADRVDVDPRVGGPSAFDVVSAEEFWVAGLKGLGHYQAGAWTILDTGSTLHADANDRAISMEHDASGVEWVATQAALYRVDGSTLQKVSLPGSGKNLALILSGKRLVLARDGDALELDGGRFTVVPGSAHEGITSVTVHPDGSIVEGLVSGGLRRVKDGSVETLALPGGDEVQTVGSDPAGRTWVGTPSGIFVVKADFSGVLRHYAVGSIEELGSTEGDEEVLQFLGIAGPVPLPPSTKERGVVVGRLMYKGKPLADRYFDMCEDPARKSSEMGSMGTPCEMSEPSWSTKTDSEGRFRLTGVDAKLYDFAAFVPGNKIGATKDSPCCLDLPDEGPLDLGDVVLK